jgi:RND superfamily putative drug exporter
VTAVCVLGALAVPALDMRAADSASGSLPAELPVVAAQDAIERAFPGAPSTAQLVVSGAALGGAEARRALAELGERGARAVGGEAAVRVEVARDKRTAIVTVPMSADGSEAQRDAVETLRERVAPTAPGGRALVTGDSARSADFAARMRSAIPVVIGFVLALAFALLLWAFRSPKLAATVVGLNLLSVGASFGVLVAVFQHGWAEDLLGFSSTGTIVSWLPLFSFVVLFGLSMDYTVLVLERIREARRAGRAPAAAAAEGVAATAGTVTSAALVMVAIFAVFATLRLLDMKQMGVGLAAAVLIDVTIVRAVALPAAVALLGENGWRVRRRARRHTAVEVPA